VENPDGKLLPGMTATVKFLVGSANDALTVPNAALRFKPAIAAAPSTHTNVRKVSVGAMADSTSMIWQLDATGALAPVRVRTGLTDGTRTQVSGSAVKEGMQIVVGANTVTTTVVATPASKNPLQPQSTGRRGGGPAGAF
jgi:HlyD family secretion protein